MRQHIANYKEWINNEKLHHSLKEEINQLKDDSDLELRFKEKLTFGTAGIRGLLGAGTNRMNAHVVAEVTQAIALKIKRSKKEKNGVVIGYDSRRMSKEFAEISASIFLRNGIKTFLFQDLTTTPLLSYAVIELGAENGIMITASHNPKEYNGYKVYNKDGIQIDNLEAKIISSIRATIKDTFSIATEVNLSGVEMINDSMLEKYLSKISNLYENNIVVDKDISIVYTPLHGTGYKPISKMLEKKGYKNVHYVKEQIEPDSEFPTVFSPNPEEEEAFELARKVGLTHNGDILIATDPDTDRVGVTIKHNGQYVYLSGNIIGVLLANYIIETKFCTGELPTNSKLIKTIATGNLVDKICEKFNVEVYNVHVGFKNIYSKVKELEEKREYGFIMGFEESLGFGISAEIARDKDAISATLMIVEMAAYYKQSGLSLLDVYNSLQDIYGYQGEVNKSISFDGLEGQIKMNEIINSLRVEPRKKIDGLAVVEQKDYLKIDNTNVIRYELEDGTWILIRPSGTEPKLKLYIYTIKHDKELANSRVISVLSWIEKELFKS